MQDIDAVIRQLKLTPHPEGGYFRETYRDPTHRGDDRGNSTAIYFLLSGKHDFTSWHRVDASEVWHFYAGAPVALETICDHHVSSQALGIELSAGQEPQLVVRPDQWQRAKSLGEWSLVGCTVSPAFEFDKFELAGDQQLPNPDIDDRPNGPAEIADVVDESNLVIGQTRRSQVVSDNLLHRGVAILVRNSAGELYVHRRTAEKDRFPSMYDMFAGGLVASGEEPIIAAAREVAEELGVHNVQLDYRFTHFYDGPTNRSFISVFDTTWDGPITHQASEVAWGSFMTVDAIREKMGSWPFVPDGLEIFQRIEREGTFAAISTNRSL